MSGAAAEEQVFREVDVGGDGNCFYRALFKAAKYHPDAGVFGRVLACFDIELAPAAADSNSNSSSEGKGHSKSKSKAKTKKARAKAKVVTDEAEEDAFAAAIRHSLAAKVEGGLFSEMEAKDAGNIYTRWKDSAKTMILWRATIDEASLELSAPFVERDEDNRITAYYPQIMKNMTEADFIAHVVSVILTEGAYASELEFSCIKFLLAQCGITLMAVDLRPDRPENVANLRIEKGGGPVLIVRRMRVMDHYRAILTEEQYKAHKAEIYPVKSAVKVTVSGLRKSATAKKSKSAAGKSRKSKGAAASSNNEGSNYNNAFAAAIAASLENK